MSSWIMVHSYKHIVQTIKQVLTLGKLVAQYSEQHHLINWFWKENPLMAMNTQHKMKIAEMSKFSGPK